VFLYVFDLMELNGDDLRGDPLVVRKATLISVVTNKLTAMASGSAEDEPTAEGARRKMPLERADNGHVFTKHLWVRPISPSCDLDHG
jgi:ATP-dependent DNA ligase